MTARENATISTSFAVVTREPQENHADSVVRCICPILGLFGCDARISRSTQLREILDGKVESWVTTTELETSQQPDDVLPALECFRDILRRAMKKAGISATMEILQVDQGAAGKTDHAQ